MSPVPRTSCGLTSPPARVNDLLTLCEAIVEDPEPILRRQVDRLKGAKLEPALGQVKATLRARIEGGLPLEGPITMDPNRDEGIA